MADLSTKYLGLDLKNPIIAGSSPLTSTLDRLKKCEDAGVGAVVLKSIFEEQIEADSESAVDATEAYLTHADAYAFVRSNSREREIEGYLTLLDGAKQSLDIPVIASINCRQNGPWIEYAKRFIDGGVDAIELNHYIVAANREEEGSAIEKEYLSLVKAARKRLSVPLSLKMGSSFSSLSNLLIKLGGLSIDGVVLFNRFFSPDIDIEKRSLVPGHMLSSSEEYALSLRWTALMSEEVTYDICASRGIHDGTTVIKQLLAGAAAVQICSVLMQKGVSVVGGMLDELSSWMDRHGYSRISDFKGMLAQERMDDPVKWERSQYMRSILAARKE